MLSFSFLRQIPSSLKDFFVESQRRYQARYKDGLKAIVTKRVHKENLAKQPKSSLIEPQKKIYAIPKDLVAFFASYKKAVFDFLKSKKAPIAQKVLNQIDYFYDEVNAEEKNLIEFLGPKNPSSTFVQSNSNSFFVMQEAFENLKGKNYFADLSDVKQYASRIFTLLTLQKKPQEFKFDFVNSFDHMIIDEVESFERSFIKDPFSYKSIQSEIENHAFCIFNIIKESLDHDLYGNITNIDPSRLINYLNSIRITQAKNG